jgi:hypothetical protein
MIEGRLQESPTQRNPQGFLLGQSPEKRLPIPISLATVQFSRSAKRVRLHGRPGAEALWPAASLRGLSKLNSMRRIPPGGASVDPGSVDMSSDRCARQVGRRSSKSPIVGQLRHPVPSIGGLPRKEVIQPQLPLRLPCYDFTPVTSPTFDGSLPKGLGHRLRVLLTPMV